MVEEDQVWGIAGTRMTEMAIRRQRNKWKKRKEEEEDVYSLYRGRSMGVVHTTKEGCTKVTPHQRSRFIRESWTLLLLLSGALRGADGMRECGHSPRLTTLTLLHRS